MFEQQHQGVGRSPTAATTMTASNKFGLPRWALEKSVFTWANLKEEHASLTLEEKLIIEDERFGLIEEIEETPALISTSLEALEVAIDAIPEKEAYETAMFVIPDHVQDDQFRLAFLRGARFNVNAAAYTLVTFWERKVTLFGTDIAFQRCGSNILDLTSEDDMIALAKGGIQILPHPDEHGRKIFYFEPSRFSDNIDSMARLWWVFNNMIVFDPIEGSATQSKGLIHIWAPTSSDTDMLSMANDLERFLQQGDKNALGIPTWLAASSVFVMASYTWVSMRLCEHLLPAMGRNARLRLSFFEVEKYEENCVRLFNQGLLPYVIPEKVGGMLEFNYKDWLRQLIHKVIIQNKRNGDYVTNDEDLVVDGDSLPEDLCQYPTLATLWNLVVNENSI
mmetsp:Transcript_25607/g.36093  ORF Transcript_25607/g.36093 Transcript_25607/m.36093 type:complete len:393 (-) Transcript_25607:259-1437(-)